FAVDDSQPGFHQAGGWPGHPETAAAVVRHGRSGALRRDGELRDAGSDELPAEYIGAAVHGGRTVRLRGNPEQLRRSGECVAVTSETALRPKQKRGSGTPDPTRDNHGLTSLLQEDSGDGGTPKRSFGSVGQPRDSRWRTGRSAHRGSSANRGNDDSGRHRATGDGRGSARVPRAEGGGEAASRSTRGGVADAIHGHFAQRATQTEKRRTAGQRVGRSNGAIHGWNIDDAGSHASGLLCAGHGANGEHRSEPKTGIGTARARDRSDDPSTTQQHLRLAVLAPTGPTVEQYRGHAAATALARVPNPDACVSGCLLQSTERPL